MESNQSLCRSQDGDSCTYTEALVLLKQVKELRENKLLCDAVLRLDDDGVFPVHRVILSMRSEYFRNLFTTQHHSEETEILLHGVSSDVMTQILDYVYFREVDIRSDNARQLLVVAEYLCNPDVPKLCCDFLKDAMDVDNCISIMQFARLHFCVDLDTYARSLVLLNFVEVSQQSEELLELPVDELQAVIEAEELNVKDERVVWECILRWMNQDPDNRKGHIADLLKGVRLERLDTKVFKEVSNHPYVTENEACRPLISETLKFLDDVERLTKEDEEFVTPRIARPRIPQDFLFAIGGCRDRRPTDVIEAYDARADRWSVVEGFDSIGPRMNHGTAVIGFDIYVIGGCDDRKSLSSCRCFNALTKTCRKVAPMHECRFSLSVAVLRGAVYATGGYNYYDYRRTAERYECKANQWSLIAPMNTGRRNASAAVLNGGLNRTSDELSTEKYVPAEDTWTEIPDMNFYSDYLKAEVFDNTIFVISRYFDKGHFGSQVAYFDDMENRWFVSFFYCSGLYNHNVLLSKSIRK
ncbi:kelch-like protein 10 isoform X2 [Zootermopsis nevadensis]|uniref:kelch-like protein 10 isoform X2 n=1 Tax=Zootermopsis nevadensis TaxID=136037 RepID=UPI000B8EAB9B|nr:kelch-like protein 10 isoform X2 [Zootermopsis nevadensis]